MTAVATRPAAVAGAFYPGEPPTLRRMIADFISAAQPGGEPPPGPVRAVIAPHAGYIYSGPIAAYSFDALRAAAAPQRVFLMGPAHYVAVPGVALGDYAAFATPLGAVPVDTATVAAMLAEQPALYMRALAAHGPEHSLEVELPFLQTVCPGVRIVPMLFGRADPEAVARDLAARLQPDDLVVVSSDLSHYHSYESARKLDGDFLKAVLRDDPAAAADGEACGVLPILTLMHMARARGWQPVLRDARNSGDTAGDRWRVVGYASVVYYDRATH